MAASSSSHRSSFWSVPCISIPVDQVSQEILAGASDLCQLKRQPSEYNDPSTSDIAVTLVGPSDQEPEKKVCLHTKMLAASSPVLAKMCELDSFDDNGRLATRIVTPSIEAVELLLQFIYTKQLQLDTRVSDVGMVGEVLHCMRLAEEYQMPDCLQACFDYASERLEHKDIDWLSAAVQWNLVDWEDGKVKDWGETAQKYVFIHWWF